MSLRNTATKGFLWTFVQSFGTQIISFGVSLILARLLMPEEFGIIGMITVFMSVGQSLIDSGLTQSIIRSDNPNQEDYSTVFFFNLAGSVVIYFAVFFAAPLIADFYRQPILTNILRVYCLSFIVMAFSAVQVARLTKQMDFKTQMFVSIPSVIVSGLLGIYMAYKGYGVWSLVWMRLFQTFLDTVQLWIRTKWTPSFLFSYSKFKEHFNFGYKLTLSGLLSIIFTNNIYQIIIGRYFIASQVGFFTQANRVQQMPVTNISGAISKVTYPIFSSIQHDNIRLKHVYKEIMQMVVFVVTPILIIMGVIAEPLFRFLFTEKWLPAVPFFQVMCLSGILYPIHTYNLNILKVRGRSDLFLRLEVVNKIIVVVIIFISIQFGIMGLVWGQLLASTIALIINSYYSGVFLDYSGLKQVLDLLPIILLSIFVGACIWFIDNFLYINKLNDFYRLSILVLSGFFLYIAFSFLFKMQTLKSIKKISLKLRQKEL